MIEYRVTWGDRLQLTLVKSGGLNPAVARIREQIGEQIGTRNTFGKLLEVTDPDGLRNVDRLRAWLLLVAVGEEPGEWSVYPHFPPVFDPVTLRELFRPTVTKGEAE